MEEKAMTFGCAPMGLYLTRCIVFLLHVCHLSLCIVCDRRLFFSLT